MGIPESTPKPKRTEGTHTHPLWGRGCRLCKQRLPLTSFAPYRPSKPPVWTCKNCVGVVNMYRGAKYRARRDGLQFTITVKDIIVPKFCPILRIPIGFDLPGTETSPSLDRIRNHLGYVIGNIQVISTRANTLKGDASLDDLICLGDWAVSVAISGTNQ